MREKMRIIIIGGGPGGYVAALRAAQLGAAVTLVGDRGLGGTCLHRGCIPSKAMFVCADLLATIKRAEEFGIRIEGQVVYDLPRIVARNKEIIATLVKGIQSLLKSWGVAVWEGRGSLIDPRTVKVILKGGGNKGGEEKTLSADGIILATGSQPAMPPHFPYDGHSIMTSDEVLELTEAPRSILIVGAGVEGCEFACFFAALGVEVTVVERMPSILPAEDEEICALLEKAMKKKGIRIMTGVTVEKMEVRGVGLRRMVTATLSNGANLQVEKGLISVGKRITTDGLGLERAGVTTGKRGEVLVNEGMETNVPGLYAIGDVTGRMMLAHVASAQAKVAAENALGGETRMDYTVVPAGIFTSPEIGRVGMTEREAAEKGYAVGVGKFPFRALGKAYCLGDTDGMVKIIADARNDEIIGCHIIGLHAADLVHEAAVAMKAGMTAADLARVIHAHPTLPEGLMEAAEDLHGRAIHLPKKRP